MTFLSLRAVCKRFDGAVAVDGVSLDVAEGSRLVIVGPSGCGKTTLLRLVAGFEVLTEGEIRLHGKAIATPDAAVPAHVRNVGYVTQDGSLFPHLDVAANIGFGLERGAAGKPDRIRDLMLAVGLPPDLASRRPHALSGGQQQRVALARALARQPSLMLLDEPFSALDTGLRESMRALVGAVLGEARVTTILVTHDQAEALSFADHLALMRDGRIVQAGAPLDLYWHPTDPESASFLGEALIVDAECRGGMADCVFGAVEIGASERTGPVKVMLRPEQIAVRPAATGGTDVSGVFGRVQSVSFGGQRSHLSVELIRGEGPVGDKPINIPIASLDAGAYTVGSTLSVAVKGSAHVF